MRLEEKHFSRQRKTEEIFTEWFILTKPHSALSMIQLSWISKDPKDSTSANACKAYNNLKFEAHVFWCWQLKKLLYFTEVRKSLLTWLQFWFHRPQFILNMNQISSKHLFSYYLVHVIISKCWQIILGSLPLQYFSTSFNRCAIFNLFLFLARTKTIFLDAYFKIPRAW